MTVCRARLSVMLSTVSTLIIPFLLQIGTSFPSDGLIFIVLYVLFIGVGVFLSTTMYAEFLLQMRTSFLSIEFVLRVLALVCFGVAAWGPMMFDEHRYVYDLVMLTEIVLFLPLKSIWFVRFMMIWFTSFFLGMSSPFDAALAAVVGGHMAFYYGDRRVVRAHDAICRRIERLVYWSPTLRFYVSYVVWFVTFFSLASNNMLWSNLCVCYFLLRGFLRGVTLLSYGVFNAFAMGGNDNALPELTEMIVRLDLALDLLL
jgi:hypothetical protein